MNCYAQRTHEFRDQIHALLNTVQNQIQIATEVGVHKATTSRKLRRNRGRLAIDLNKSIAYPKPGRQATLRRSRLKAQAAQGSPADIAL